MKTFTATCTASMVVSSQVFINLSFVPRKFLQMLRNKLAGCLFGVILLWQSAVVADEVTLPKSVTSRLFWQDDQTRAVYWCDVTSIDGDKYTPRQTIKGFPKLDPEHQSLVQMDTANGYILVGVRDDQDGELQSGWILINTGIEEEVHGDHSHWTYRHAPKVQAMMLDQKQGNPAHLYVYNDVFYVANDKNNGFTRLDAKAIKAEDSTTQIQQAAQFFSGGSGHITLAADDPHVVYATWNDREGSNQGRVDVVSLRGAGKAHAISSFQLTSGGLHGCTINSGNVFLAPLAGVAWFAATKNGAAPKTEDVHYFDLGTQGGKPLRTGSFTNYKQHVAFTAGVGAQAAIYSVDAKANQLQLSKLTMNLGESMRLSGLEIFPVKDSGPHAFVFHSDPDSPEASRTLHIIELDPNQDQNWQDARKVKSIDVGAAVPEGHGGSHAVGSNGVGRLVYWTHPAAGEISCYSLIKGSVVATHKVEGIPSKVLVVGQRGNVVRE